MSERRSESAKAIILRHQSAVSSPSMISNLHFVQDAMNVLRNDLMMRICLGHKLYLPLNSGNIFKDAFPFLWPREYRTVAPSLENCKDTLTIRVPQKYVVRFVDA